MLLNQTQFFIDLIARSTVSVFHDDNGSDYVFSAPQGITMLMMDANGEIVTGSADEDFTLSCQYLLIGSTPYGFYKLEYGDTVLMSAKTPILTAPKTKTARDLIMLARACSRKIIAQQKLAESRNMILGMKTENQHSC